MARSIGNSILFFVLIATIYCSCLVQGDDADDDDDDDLAKFGQTCNLTMKCDSSDFLDCKFTECECRATLYESQQFKTQNTSCCEIGYRGETVPYQSYGCHQCRGQGVCKCKQGYIENANSTCDEIGGFYQPCQNTTDCLNEKYGLICLQNKCQCDPSVAVDNFSQIKSKSKRQCVGLAGKDTIRGECTKDAQFKLFHPKGKVFDMICVCKPPTLPDKNGLCSIVEYGGPCDIENDDYTCHPNFTCTNYKCGCPYSRKYQIYDESLKNCRSLVRGPCKFNGSQDQCVHNAKCVLNEEFGKEHAQCECEDGFVANAEGECDYAFGSKCKMAAGNGTKIIKCSQIAPLVCKNGKCECEDELQKFDHNTRKCIVLAGGICDENTTCEECTICLKKLDGRGQCGFPRLDPMPPRTRKQCLLPN